MSSRHRIALLSLSLLTWAASGYAQQDEPAPTGDNTSSVTPAQTAPGPNVPVVSSAQPEDPNDAALAAAADPNEPAATAVPAPNEPALAVAPDPNEPVLDSPRSDVEEPTSTATASPEKTGSPDIEAEPKTADDSDKAVAEQEPAPLPEPAKTAPAEPEMSIAEVIALLKAQQEQIDEQKKQIDNQQYLLDSQSQQIANLTRELDVLRAPAPVDQPSMVAKVETDTLPVETGSEKEISRETITETATTEQQTEKAEAVAKAQTDDPTRAMLEDFVGAWRLPGTNAALSVGGFVKTAIVYNWDPLEINDRFIVGSIPVGVDEGIEAQSSVTANQSRLNFDLREPTDFGLFRAFIEGDFAEEGDTFRLRHAFGQWKDMLAGKTWSAFVDTEASPEEVDFEGLNGRISLRQSQIRLTPKIGKEYEFQFSMEDPNPRVQNGNGVTRAPDFVFSGRFEPYNKLHTKVALLLRQIRAQRDTDYGGGVEKEYAWGLTVSGRYRVPRWDERDSLLFQVNAGDGIGRYVNDLSSVGNFDGVFDPDSGDLELYDILSGYISFQHWWGTGNQLRSNFTLGYVGVDNPDFIDGNAYKRTVRASSNLFWSPTPRIDIGGEYLWGKRENEDGNNADATQMQLAVRYRF